MSAPTASTHTRVGAAPPGYNQGNVTRTVKFHDFASLLTVRNDRVYSPEFMLMGNQWRLHICPGGDTSAAEGMTSIYLWNKSNTAIEIDFGFSVSDGSGKQVAYKRSTTPRNFGPVDVSSWGFADLATRTTLLNSLINGTLIIEVHMRLAKPTTSVPPPYIPENPFAKNIQRMIMDENFGDISFAVGGNQKKSNAKKIAKTAPAIVYAHRDILRECSTGILADICRSNVASTSSPIEITDVSSDVFRLLLFYMYGGKLSDDDMKSHAKELVDAADRFGVVSLKIEAEAYIVGDIVFSLENVMEHLLYAESKNCALLKEAAIDFLVENKADVIEKLITNDLIPASLIKDLFVPVLRGEKKDGIVGDIKSQLADMRINELRRMAHEKCLNVDESREMLIAALKSV